MSRAFKDRHFLEQDPHRFLEGMLIAAKVVGIAEVYIYLQDEYAGIRAMLERELGSCSSTRRAGCRLSTCVVEPAPISAVKSPP